MPSQLITQRINAVRASVRDLRYRSNYDRDCGQSYEYHVPNYETYAECGRLEALLSDQLLETSRPVNLLTSASLLYKRFGKRPETAKYEVPTSCACWQDTAADHYPRCKRDNTNHPIHSHPFAVPTHFFQLPQPNCNVSSISVRSLCFWQLNNGRRRHIVSSTKPWVELIQPIPEPIVLLLVRYSEQIRPPDDKVVC